MVEEFIASHSELTGAEQDTLGWRDVVEGVFDVVGKDRDALVLFNFLDESSITISAPSRMVLPGRPPRTPSGLAPRTCAVLERPRR